MKVLILGASSYVGARIYFDLKDEFELVGSYHQNKISDQFIQLDLPDKDKVLSVFKEVNPEVVIHTANFPSPKSAVGNEENFIKLNDVGTVNVVEASNEVRAKLIFISSQAANNATDIYGKLKAKSEKLVQQVKAGYLVVRPSAIVGFSPNTTNPRLFNRILKCIDEKRSGERFDNSWKLQPTYLGHISKLITRAIKNNIWNTEAPIFIDEIVTQYQIAQDILNNYGLGAKAIDMGIKILPSKDKTELFDSMDLKPKTYKEMIETILQEILNKDRFIL